MTPEQLLEATAKAIYAACVEHLPPREVTKWEKLPDDAKEVWLRCARAALATAIKAAAKVIEGWDTYDVWRSDGAAAIRALLPPEETP
jgi:hypothetical protein